jgi:hypothetical protein
MLTLEGERSMACVGVSKVQFLRVEATPPRRIGLGVSVKTISLVMGMTVS